MAKRINGEGSIRKRKDGRWEARFFDNTTQQQRSVYGKTQKEVKDKLKERIKNIDDGIDLRKNMITVEQWFNMWLKQYNINIKPLTMDSYTAIVHNHIIPTLGHIKLGSTNTEDIQSLYNYLIDKNTGKGLSIKTLKNVHGVMHKAFNQAVELCYIKKNPVNACVLPQYHKKEITPMDSDIVKTFLDKIKVDKFYDIFFITLFTGMRQGEVLGLKWDCVDFKNGTITVKRQLQKRKRKGSNYYLAPTKNGKARVIVPAPIVIDILQKIKEQQDKHKKEYHEDWINASELDGLVFTTKVGVHLIPCTIYKHYKKIVKEMGESNLRFHDLRHSFAVISLENGDDIKTIQETLGHHSAAFTLDTYSHVTTQMQKRSAERMQTFIADCKVD